jgi:hypothetical protein
VTGTTPSGSTHPARHHPRACCVMVMLERLR